MELKTPEDLQKVLTEHGEKLNAIPDIDSRLNEFGESMKEIKEAVASFGRRVIVDEKGNGYKLPVTKADWNKFGMKALHRATTPLVEEGKDAGPVAEMNDAADLAICEVVLRKWPLNPETLKRTTIYRDRFKPALDKVQSILKADLNTSIAGEGDEWAPLEYSRQLIDRIRLSLRVAPLFRRFDMPRSPYMFPVWRNDLVATRVVEPTIDPVFSPTPTSGLVANTSSNMTFVGQRLNVNLAWSWDIEEDSIVPLSTELRNHGVIGVRNGIDGAIIRGDADGTHQDSDVNTAGATHAWWSWNGLVRQAKLGTADVTAGGRINTDGQWNLFVRGAIGLMGRYGGDGSRLAIITSPAGSNQVREIARFATAYAFLGMATNRVPDLNTDGFTPDGITFVVSEFVRQDLNVGAVFDNITTDNTCFVIVNRDAWFMADMGQVAVKPLGELYAGTAQNGMILTWRGDFKQAFVETDNHTGLVMDVTVP